MLSHLGNISREARVFIDTSFRRFQHGFLLGKHLLLDVTTIQPNSSLFVASQMGCSSVSPTQFSTVDLSTLTLGSTPTWLIPKGKGSDSSTELELQSPQHLCAPLRVVLPGCRILLLHAVQVCSLLVCPIVCSGTLQYVPISLVLHKEACASRRDHCQCGY